MKNKYKITSVLSFCFAVILLVIMIIHSMIDYNDYLQHPEYSAPFSVNLLIKGITYGIPTIISFILSIVFNYKTKESWKQ